MPKDIKTDYLCYKPFLKTRHFDGKTELFDPIRKKYLVLQPEELVRQLVIQFLIQKKGFSKNKISVEKVLFIGDLQRRYDVLVFDKNTLPFLLVECKAPSIPISQATIDQIAQYNMALQVQYLLVTNGMTTYCCKMDYKTKSYRFLTRIPSAPKQKKENK